MEVVLKFNEIMSRNIAYVSYERVFSYTPTIRFINYIILLSGLKAVFLYFKVRILRKSK